MKSQAAMSNQQTIENPQRPIEQIDDKWDVVVIGGGITGMGVAREAARQGLKVLVLEQKDFAWGTSSRSSKMVHGGLRYLASGNLRLTSHSVKERERLMNEAPGLVDLMAYSWPHYKKQFPGPFVFNVLLALYDLFAGKKYRKFLTPEETSYVLPHIRHDALIGSTQFADAVTDDTRLVMRVMDEAKMDGATCLNYTRVVDVIKQDGMVKGVECIDEYTGKSYSFFAKAVVSATGAWADQLRANQGAKKQIRPQRGSHLVIPQWRFPVAQAITLKHPEDNRSMFIYPWEGTTVVGTTDLDHPDADLKEPHIHQFEIHYLLKAANALFPGANLKKEDVVATWAGVRPIVSSGKSMNPSSEKRDHSIWDDNGLVTVSGGKLTTFRLIALDVLKALKKYMPDIKYKDNGARIFTKVEQEPAELEQFDGFWKKRLVGFYGCHIDRFFDCAEPGELAVIPGTQSLWAQLRYSCRYESVVHLDDLLLRRTRIGLLLANGGSDFKEQIKAICQSELSWADEQWHQEWQRYQDIWHAYYSVTPEK